MFLDFIPSNFPFVIWYSLSKLYFEPIVCFHLSLAFAIIIANCSCVFSCHFWLFAFQFLPFIHLSPWKSAVCPCIGFIEIIGDITTITVTKVLRLFSLVKLYAIFYNVFIATSVCSMKIYLKLFIGNSFGKVGNLDLIL